MERFTYLGSVISNDATVSKDRDNRLSKASSSFGRLSKRVWQSLVPLLHGEEPASFPPSCTETWILYRKQLIRLLERFY